MPCPLSSLWNFLKGKRRQTVDNPPKRTIERDSPQRPVAEHLIKSVPLLGESESLVTEITLEKPTILRSLYSGSRQTERSTMNPTQYPQRPNSIDFAVPKSYPTKVQNPQRSSVELEQQAKASVINYQIPQRRNNIPQQISRDNWPPTPERINSGPEEAKNNRSRKFQSPQRQKSQVQIPDKSTKRPTQAEGQNRNNFKGRRTLSRYEDWKSLSTVENPIEIFLKIKACEASAKGFVSSVSTFEQFYVVFEVLRVLNKSSYKRHALNVTKLIVTTNFLARLTALFRGDVICWIERGIVTSTSLCRCIKESFLTIQKNVEHFEVEGFPAQFNILLETIIAFLDEFDDRTSRMGMGSKANLRNLLVEFLELRNGEMHEKGVGSGAVCFYPTDLFTEKKSIEPNITKGSYTSAAHYIQTHLGLLKEDFESRLRAGIALYLEDQKAKNHDIWVYTDVSVDVSSGERHMFKIVLTSGSFSKIEWEKSNRFLHGSMVIVTKENVKGFHIAIVKDRGNVESNKILTDNKYYIYVEFITAPPRHNSYDRYVLIEPKTFFEPYHQVMMAMTSFYRTGLPLERYLVDIDMTSCLPKYVNCETTYNIETSVVQLSNHAGWPSSASMALNESQRSAIISALTNELVLIQGPPGTGKTYMAYKMIKYLLDNNQFSSPILVVCFKNHSLDQLLEGLLERGVRLLRVGGQSKSEKLKECNLSKVQASGISSVFKELKNIERSMEKNAETLHFLWNSVSLLKTKRGIVHLSQFRKFNVISQTELQLFGGEEGFNKWLLGSNLFVDDNLPFPAADQIKAMSHLSCSPTLVYSLSMDEIIKNIEGLRTEHTKLVVTSKKKTLNTNQLEQLYEIGENLDINAFNFNVLRTRLNEFDKVITNEQSVRSLLASTNLNDLTLKDRWKIYRFWEDQLLALNEILLEKAIDERFWLKESHRELKDMFKCRQIESARPQVLGITTSGAAAHHRILEQIAPPVVIVEEAAEVLESHIVASISKSCQQLILIGDHQQLKPSTASHVLAEKYRMNVSLFERMMRNEARCDALDVQHRMRPEISALICPSIYPNLVNHSSVFNYPDVPGVTKNVLFFHHTRFEEVASDSESRFNRFEADFTLALCSYLLKQEAYKKKPSRITILTTYKEQERVIKQGRQRLGLDLPDVVITAVDNYQGEENDVIILSLVRSNLEGKVGFLATKNRVCVALSRAKHGLFIMGNIDCLVKKQSSIWCEISNVLQSQNAIVVKFPLKCKIHGNVTLVRNANEILALKLGGCPQKCQTQLDCGHVCLSECHGYDVEHNKMFKCQSPCLKKCQDGHLCQEVCSAECPPCPVPVRRKLPCSHYEDVPCHETPDYGHCKQCIFLHIVECGHEIGTMCRERHKAKCNVPCEADLSCGHRCTQICHVSDDRFHEKHVCEQKCLRTNLTCPNRHLCTRLCFEECGLCLFKVTRVLPCTHSIRMECSKLVEDVQCKKGCQKILTKCHHLCPNECWMPCGPCKAEVDHFMLCGHKTKLLCGSEIPVTGECNQKCNRLKKDCGHSCFGQCKDDCSQVTCSVKVTVKLLCGHCIRIPCHKRKASMDVMLGWCTSPCREILANCGHECTGTCGSCLQGRIHKGCEVVCNKTLRCSHKCKAPCGQLFHSCNRRACVSVCWTQPRDLSERFKNLSIKQPPLSYQQAFNQLNGKFLEYTKRNNPGKIKRDCEGALANLISQVSVSTSNIRVERKTCIVPLMTHLFLLEFVTLACRLMAEAKRKPQYSSVSNCLDSLIESLGKRDLHRLTSEEISQAATQLTFLQCCLLTTTILTEGKCLLEHWNDPKFGPKKAIEDERLKNALFSTTTENVLKICHHDN